MIYNEIEQCWESKLEDLLPGTIFSRRRSAGKWKKIDQTHICHITKSGLGFSIVVDPAEAVHIISVPGTGGTNPKQTSWKQRALKAEAILKEQEDIICGVGPTIVCRNGKKHPTDNYKSCIYCVVERLERIVAMSGYCGPSCKYYKYLPDGAECTDKGNDCKFKLLRSK